MNGVKRMLDGELVRCLDRLAVSVSTGSVAHATSIPTLRANLEEIESRLAGLRQALLSDYDRWRLALDDLENLWALASWRSAAAEEPVDQSSALAA